MEYFSLKLLHIVSATILFGTGLGSAFYMFVANRQKNIKTIYFVVKTVVVADWMFTTPAVIVQLISGMMLMQEQGYSFEDNWLVLALALYIFAGICWLPVVWLQIKMRDMAKVSAQNNSELPKLYFVMNKWWIILGSLAFPAVLVVFYLMVFKPDF